MPSPATSEWVLNAHSPRRRRGAVVDDVEPVRLAHVAGLCPLVGEDLNIARRSSSFHLDAARVTIRPTRQQVEAWIVWQPSGASQLGRVHVEHGCALRLFPFASDLHRKVLDLGVVLLAIERIRRRHHQCVREKLHWAKRDELRFSTDRGNGAFAPARQLTLCLFDPFQLCPRRLVARADLVRLLRTRRREIRLLKAEATLQE